MNLRASSASRASLILLAGAVLSHAANPIVTGVGMADPHVHVWPSNPNKLIVYATHDCNKAGHGSCVKDSGGDSRLGFYMTDWWIWSSTDLVSWTMETKLLPTTLPWEDENTSKECWATDAASFANGSTYFYLSVGPKQVGVVSGPSPTGPFTDPIKKPLVPIGLVPTYSRDPGVLMDDDGNNYLIFGTFNYFMAKLGPDMVTLAEKPRGVKIIGEQHRDDKAFLHKRRGVYYLSWGCWYAMGHSPYGPFNYTGGIIDVAALAGTPFASGGGTQDRHGSFFEFKGQTYFACNDRSHGGGGGFRSSIIAYVHYRDNGTIPAIRIDETGVGNYRVNVSASSASSASASKSASDGDAGVGVVQAEEFFELVGEHAEKRQITAGGDDSGGTSGDDQFEIVGLGDGCKVGFPKMRVTLLSSSSSATASAPPAAEAAAKAAASLSLSLRVSNGAAATGKVMVMVTTSPGMAGVAVAATTQVGSCSIAPTGGWDKYATVACGQLPTGQNNSFVGDVSLSFAGGVEVAHLDYLSFTSG